MTEKEKILENLKGKSKEEVRDFIVDMLKEICEDAEKLSVNEEDYETASELLEIKKRVK